MKISIFNRNRHNHNLHKQTNRYRSIKTRVLLLMIFVSTITYFQVLNVQLIRANGDQGNFMPNSILSNTSLIYNTKIIRTNLDVPSLSYDVELLTSQNWTVNATNHLSVSVFLSSNNPAILDTLTPDTYTYTINSTSAIPEELPEIFNNTMGWEQNWPNPDNLTRSVYAEDVSHFLRGRYALQINYTADTQLLINGTDITVKLFQGFLQTQYTC